MTESSDELERQIREIKHELKTHWSELEDKVKSSMDWRAQFEEHPGTMLAVAFGGGVLLSALLPRGRSSRRTVRERDRSVQSIRDDAASSVGSRADYERKPNKGSEPWSALKAAVVGAAAGKLSEFVEELIPGSTSGQTGRTYDRPRSSSQSTWPKSNVAASD